MNKYASEEENQPTDKAASPGYKLIDALWQHPRIQAGEQVASPVSSSQGVTADKGCVEQLSLSLQLASTTVSYRRELTLPQEFGVEGRT